ncbi:hypothetical protein C2G38_2238098 [Gigaspora rosea]|uniref:BACK domain-containing protein n=1 Tax=Gigaspora rosea TaxID=44941 RepID=A0A397WDV1_9GLOM|nr:hypothetical protein C2G38_2238098 [Gigaspora rosea]
MNQIMVQNEPDHGSNEPDHGSNEPIMMTTKIIEKLLNDYIELLNDEEDFNAIINVGKIPDIYLWGSHLLDNLDVSFIFELMFIVCKFFLEELAKYIEAYLIETKAHWLHLHFAHVYQESFKNFTLLHENALVSLVGQDYLQTGEINIWNYVIKWGIAQNPDLPTDSKDWTYENFSIFEDYFTKLPISY